MADSRKYLVVIERADDGSYSAFVPDLPGCVACGLDSPEQARELIRKTIEAHVHGMREDGQPIPEPTASSDYVETVA